MSNKMKIKIKYSIFFSLDKKQSIHLIELFTLRVLRNFPLLPLGIRSVDLAEDSLQSSKPSVNQLEAEVGEREAGRVVRGSRDVGGDSQLVS